MHVWRCLRLLMTASFLVTNQNPWALPDKRESRCSFGSGMLACCILGICTSAIKRLAGMDPSCQGVKITGKH